MSTSSKLNRLPEVTAPTVSVGRMAFVIAMSVCALWPTTLLAATQASDGTATRAYLRASDTYALGASAGLQARVATLETRSSEIAGRCPSALTYAPRDAAFGQLSEATVTALVYASAAPQRSMLLRTAGEIGHLRWSNPTLTRLVRLRAAEESGVASVVPPDVCAEIVLWKASAYVALPQGMDSFIERSEALESESFVGFSEEPREAVILRMLKPYENQSDRRVAKRVERLEAQFNRRFSSALSAAKAKLAVALGASAL